MSMIILFAQSADAVGSIAVQGAVGVASLAIAGLFLKYIRERDAQAERQHVQCEETIGKIVEKHENAMNCVTDSFRSEMAAEREKRDQERKEFRDSLQQLRNQVKQ